MQRAEQFPAKFFRTKKRSHHRPSTVLRLDPILSNQSGLIPSISRGPSAESVRARVFIYKLSTFALAHGVFSKLQTGFNTRLLRETLDTDHTTQLIPTVVFHQPSHQHLQRNTMQDIIGLPVPILIRFIHRLKNINV